MVVEVGGAAQSRSTDMEAGAAGVSVLEAEEKTSVLGIGLRELMRVAVSVEFDDTQRVARHYIEICSRINSTSIGVKGSA